MARAIVSEITGPLAMAPRCDVYRLGGSCGHFARWEVTGAWDVLTACDEHLARIARGQGRNEPLAPAH